MTSHAHTRLLAPAAALALVAGLAFDAVHADDPTRPIPGAADPMTMAGQRLVAAKFGRQHTPSAVIFPEQDMPLRFSHAKHTALVECVDCHMTAGDSLRASDDNLPREASCLDCHDVKAATEGKPVEAPSSCDTCHPGFQPKWLPGATFADTRQVEVHPPAVHMPVPNLKFNHKIHMAKGATCETCHGTMKDIDLATRENALPLMSTCLTCHDGKKAADSCKTCHLTDPSGKVDWDLPTGKLAPEGWYFMDAHDDKWLAGHRNVANLGDENCYSCHTQKDCLDCHNGVKKPIKIHPNNWITQHAMQARKDQPACSSCHRSQAFCVDCHQLTKVVRDGPEASRAPGSLQFHPEGWMEVGQRSTNHHSFAAQRNIQACASCHTEQTCISCHATEGLGGAYAYSPHPPGWSSSGACARMRNKNERVCYKCHTPSDPELQCRN